MAPPVITITRQYASGGSEVARLLAAELRWDVIDNEFVYEVARHASLPPETDRQRDQYVRTYYRRHRQDVVNYDMVVNTEKLGIDGAAALVVAEARRRKWS